MGEGRERGGERVGTGGEADGDGEDVVDDQAGGGQQARGGTEVGPGDGVGATAGRVNGDDLPV
ncbi:hypothetical protein [Streptomyces sp. NPDC086777]|uniref:hypothetical protein n=1 Tax=Streptomyces sp. NPDC086777 TaxID=3154866 RepID=UPI00344BDE56